MKPNISRTNEQKVHENVPMFSGQHNFGGGKYQISAQAWKKTKKPKKIRYDLYIRKDTSEKKKENLAQRKKTETKKLKLWIYMLGNGM